MAQQPRGTPALPRLKTCETCFRAKIKCERTQDTGSCDRCLRLSKNCVFAVARHGRLPERFRRPLSGVHDVPGNRIATETSAYASRTASPYERSNALITVGDDDASNLLHIYNSRMLPHFPFVLVPNDLSVKKLRDQRPCLFLAIMAVASHQDAALQAQLGRQFNALVADRLMQGHITSLDLIQGLLVHTAW